MKQKKVTIKKVPETDIIEVIEIKKLEVADTGGLLEIVKNNRFKKTEVVITLAILLFVVSLVAIYFYKQLNDIKKGFNQATAAERMETILAVDKLIVLPSDEQPTVATVTDLEKLKDQEFFNFSRSVTVATVGCSSD